MECQDNLELYLNLSRKELQELCKKNDLPANRRTTQLAKSLASFFKKKVASSTLLKVRSSGTTDAASYNSCLPDIYIERGTPFPGGETVRGAYEKSVNSSESDTHKMLPFTEETGSGDKPYCQNQDQLGNSDFMDHQTFDDACDTDAITIGAYTFNQESTDAFARPLSKSGDIDVKSSVSGDVQLAAIGSQLGHWCHHGSIKNESKNSQNPRNNDQSLFVNTTGNNEAHLLSSQPPRLLENPTKVGYASSYQSSIKETPSFDFFVMSDEGINLYVDLNSSPSEWMKSFKDEVHINQSIQPGSLGNHTRDFLDVDGHMKSLQSKSIGLNLKKKGAERDTVCTNSSLSSVFSGNCQFDVYPSDATLASSGSSILTSTSNPVEIRGSLEGNQVVSSACIAYSNFENLMTIDNTSLHQEDNILPQDNLDIPFRVEQSNTEVSTPGNSASAICEKNKIHKCDNSSNNVERFDVGTRENHVCVGHISSLEKESRCGVLFGACHYEKSSGSCQLGGQTNAHSGARLCCDHSSSIKDSVPRDSNSTFGENLSFEVLDKERSEYSEFERPLDKNSKCSPEFDEEILNKRHHSDQNIKGYLGCTMSSNKEIVTDATIPPRRSSRFLSK